MKTILTSMLIVIASAAIALADQSIADVQRSLKDQGFYYGQITGQKDADTTAAVRRYQIRHGLQITGELNEETLNSIKSSESNAAQASPARIPRPALSPPSDANMSDLPAQAAPPAPPLNPTPRPQTADEWSDRPNVGRPVPSGIGVFAGTPYQTAPVDVQRRVIADAQRILMRRGLFREEVSGAFGPALEFSLRAYQARIGLPATGRLDLETLAALELLPGARAPVFGPRRPVVPSDAPVRGEWVRP
jgi:peptidoglycan hydrolase-like protein with peptidoglycan-binding domain